MLSGGAEVYVGQECIAAVWPDEVPGICASPRGLRNAAATTTGRAEVMHISRNDVSRLLDEVPALREAMDASVAQHVPGAVAADTS